MTAIAARLFLRFIADDFAFSLAPDATPRQRYEYARCAMRVIWFTRRRR